MGITNDLFLWSYVNYYKVKEILIISLQQKISLSKFSLILFSSAFACNTKVYMIHT